MRTRTTIIFNEGERRTLREATLSKWIGFHPNDERITLIGRLDKKGLEHNRSMLRASRLALVALVENIRKEQDPNHFLLPPRKGQQAQQGGGGTALFADPLDMVKIIIETRQRQEAEVLAAIALVDDALVLATDQVEIDPDYQQEED